MHEVHVDGLRSSGRHLGRIEFADQGHVQELDAHHALAVDATSAGIDDLDTVERVRHDAKLGAHVETDVGEVHVRMAGFGFVGHPLLPVREWVMEFSFPHGEEGRGQAEAAVVAVAQDHGVSVRDLRGTTGIYLGPTERLPWGGAGAGICIAAARGVDIVSTRLAWRSGNRQGSDNQGQHDCTHGRAMMAVLATP